MILGHEEILRRIRGEKLLEGVEEGNVGGAGVDLRLGKAYRMRSGGKLGKEKRVTPEVEEISGEGDEIKLLPGEYVLVETLEKVNMPADLMARILQRSSLFRCGASLRNAVVDPGYKGTLTFGLKNEGEHEFRVERGARICQIVFELVVGGTKLYEGKYQGGKVV